jgi:hypothetical protein
MQVYDADAPAELLCHGVLISKGDVLSTVAFTMP